MSVFRPTLNPGIGPRDDLPDILLTWFIQVTGLAAALIFGVFSILSWVDSQHAKEQAKAANLLAVAAICAQVGDERTNEAMQAICGPFFRDAWPNLSAAVGDLLPYVPTRTRVETTSISTTTSGSLSTSTGRTLPPPGNMTSSMSQGGGYASSSTRTMQITATPSSIPNSASSSSGRGGAASSKDIGLGVGLGVGLVTIIVSGLTVWKMRRRSRKMVYAPVQGHGGAPD